MFEYGSSVPRNSVLAKLAGVLLLLAFLLRIASSVANTEKALWACFLAWSVLSLIEGFSSKGTEKPARDELAMQQDPGEKPELPIWWRVFGPLAAFNLVTLFLGLWPLGGLGILLWLISWFVYDFIESSRLGRRGLVTLSLR
jgi:hypothetical protein